MDIPPFSIRLPVPYEGYFYDRNNQNANYLKDYLRQMTDGLLTPNKLGQFASGLVHGRVFRHYSTIPTGLYGIADGGKGITFHDPDKLYRDWPKHEKQVGPAMHSAMRALIDNALRPS